MIVAKVVEQLRNAFGPNSTFGAADFFAAQENAAPVQDLALFVIPLTEAGENVGDGSLPFTIANNIRIAVSVDLKCADFRAEAGMFDAMIFRRQLFRVLLNWRADSCFYAARYVNGALLSANAARVFYGYTFNFPEAVAPDLDGYDPTTNAPVMDLRYCLNGVV